MLNGYLYVDNSYLWLYLARYELSAEKLRPDIIIIIIIVIIIIIIIISGPRGLGVTCSNRDQRFAG